MVERFLTWLTLACSDKRRLSCWTHPKRFRKQRRKLWQQQIWYFLIILRLSADFCLTGRPGSNRSSVADVNSIPPMEAMVPVPNYADSGVTESNYDLPPPPDMLNDANSQSTTSMDVRKLQSSSRLIYQSRPLTFQWDRWIWPIKAFLLLRNPFRVRPPTFQLRQISFNRRLLPPSNSLLSPDSNYAVPLILTGHHVNSFKKEMMQIWPSRIRHSFQPKV